MHEDILESIKDKLSHLPPSSQFLSHVQPEQSVSHKEGQLENKENTIKNKYYQPTKIDKPKEENLDDSISILTL